MRRGTWTMCPNVLPLKFMFLLFMICHCQYHSDLFHPINCLINSHQNVNMSSFSIMKQIDYSISTLIRLKIKKKFKIESSVYIKFLLVLSHPHGHKIKEGKDMKKLLTFYFMPILLQSTHALRTLSTTEVTFRIYLCIHALFVYMG